EEAAQLTEEVVGWIQQNLGVDYEWPGNFRELSQCIRNVMIRGSYTPQKSDAKVSDGDARNQLGNAVAKAQFTMTELEQHYISLVYADEGTYTATAERLGLNWRTVKTKVVDTLAEKYKTDVKPHRQNDSSI
ncbi:MAG: hypothetical protein KDA84_04280, partial [Planctomycetaceae bacterium]|nr:hypothetical protein [Planctomycetaceae bacterium]